PLYIVCLAVIYHGNVLLALLARRKLNLERVFWLVLALVIGTWSIEEAWHRHYDTGYLAILTLSFFTAGVLFWSRYRRWSPGVIISGGGFLLWAAVFPVGAFIDAHYPGALINPELWNTPKFFVAFGMILTLLEDKSTVLEDNSQREQKLNLQLQKFASITSRLLTGVEVNRLCDEIAQAITETSTFRRVAITLSADDNSFYVAGHSGLDEETLQQLRQRATTRKAAEVAEFRRMGSPLGRNCYLLKPEQAAPYGPMRSDQDFDPNPYWQNGNELVVPLQSNRDTCVGWISMDDPRDVARVTASEMTKIELLAGDLAVTIDNGVLHRQLVRAEKLAAIGQLVAGVAHELNNPLASVIGYSELMTDDIAAGPARQKLDKLLREAHRMRRIIENLLRFARQNSLEKKSADLQTLLDDVLALRDYHIRNNDIEVEVVIQPKLPPVAVDEDQFKQILLNLLNNSIDAMERAPVKHVRIEAVQEEKRIVVRFDDTGPGFDEVGRVFDPFYTTKPVGKGTGLGLSICYGIVKEHGGDIYAINLEPCGARVVVELPVYDPVAASAPLGNLQRPSA
ncbi:MAG TPA: HAMP domain-containing sensor histidine kinase, partial [Candidatus Angelobacter sp.]|nr:HAMP domain-containing sensor histidine kinase [Candidatus Angelobacter sp.]